MDRKRIIFVDDEPLVLDGLRRTLRGQRDEWEMEFVENAEQALNRMAQAPFDVIVSDMRMPGMNGGQLLAQVKLSYPKTVRIILSGYADKELILQCVASTHQYLSKPCEPDALKAAVRRSTSIDFLRQHERLRTLVGRIDHLPSPPTLYTAIVEALNDPEASTDVIGELVARDIGMTVRMLKLVNSAFFGLGRPLTHPAEAVNHLGLETVKSLVLALGAFGQIGAKAPTRTGIDRIWTHSVAVSACARIVAEEEGADRKTLDEAFVSGLLHDIGKLVLSVNLPEEAQRVQELAGEKNLSELDAEREVFGTDHAAIGGYMLSLWGLPMTVVEAVGLHHDPCLSASAAFTPLTAVHAANALVHAPSPGDAPGPLVPIDPCYLEAAGVRDHVDRWRFAWKASLGAPPPNE